MSVLSIIAFITGVLGVWLTIKQNIYCWPAALISVVTSMLEFFNEKLYGDMALQVVYFAAGVYGWIYWQKNLKEEFRVSNVPSDSLISLTIITITQAVLYYFLLSYFGGDKPVFDAILTAASLTATYMMIRKWVENWFAWVIIDSAYVFLYGIKQMWLFSLLYLIFAVIAFIGWLKWRKALLKK
jgi:nicotinamide mononucleotide transporter